MQFATNSGEFFFQLRFVFRALPFYDPVKPAILPRDADSLLIFEYYRYIYNFQNDKATAHYSVTLPISYFTAHKTAIHRKKKSGGRCRRRYCGGSLNVDGFS